MANTKNKSVTVVKSRRTANIIMFVVIGIAAFVLVAIAVLSLISVDPMSDIKRPERYEFYGADSTNLLPADEKSAQSGIYAALDGMDFTVMTGILQGKWDYSYSFIRNKSNKKIKVAASDITGLRAKENGFMIEFVYPQIPVVNGKLDYKKAQKIVVDGQTVYYDRIKMFVTDSEGEVGTLRFYPYIYARLDNKAIENDELSSETYSITGITVRANTTDAYSALKKLEEKLK
ncbi:MAG: hypothetical protein J1G38_06555 [Clostridiales bacterium]|nr:hypothetical protein [Clostridiales bacterium]